MIHLRRGDISWEDKGSDLLQTAASTHSSGQGETPNCGLTGFSVKVPRDCPQPGGSSFPHHTHTPQIGERRLLASIMVSTAKFLLEAAKVNTVLDS